MNQELNAELTNEALYAEYEQAVEEENAVLALSLEKELEDRGVNMRPFHNSLPRHIKAQMLAYV